MHLHTHQQPKLVLPPTTLKIYNNWADEPIATITRNGRKACVAVAKAHYSGPNFRWEWA